MLSENLLLAWKIDCVSLLNDARRRPHSIIVPVLAEELAYAWRDIYSRLSSRRTNVIWFLCGTFEYIYDEYASLETAGVVPPSTIIEARLVVASGISWPQKRMRDDYRLKGWVGPTQQRFGREWDKGHFIGHSIGGAVDQAEVNVFVQRRSLNRGWSVEGRRFRKMEAYCESHPGTFCFSRPMYFNQTARPAYLEFGVLKNDDEMWVEWFDNQ